MARSSTRLGLIARADNSGLGTLSWELANHLKFEKILVVKNGVYQIFPDRFPGGRITHKDKIGREDIDYITTGIDRLLVIETPYNESVVKAAQKRGVRVVFMPMYECLQEDMPFMPDFFLCPSKLDFRLMPRPKRYLPFPVNRKRLPFRERKYARVFLHNAGHGGIAARNGTNELLAAIPMVKNNVRFIINTQRHIEYSHPKVEIRVGNFENYWDLWREGDVFVIPQKFAGLSLPVQEALSVGMPVLHTMIYPFTEMLPPEWLIPGDIVQARPGPRMIDYAVVAPEEIAKKIDEFANRNIQQDSMRANRIAETLDWSHLKERYLEAIEKLQ